MPNASLPRVAAAALLLALAGAAAPAHATDYFTPKALLGEFFADAKKVAPHAVTLSEADAAAIAGKLGVDVHTFPRRWSVYAGEAADGQRTGYAMLDHELGLHELIDFGVRFDLQGAVRRVEIMAFREPYGDGIRGARYRAKFVGKTAADPITAGVDIDIVSGASISSRSVAVGVKRDTLVLQAALKSGQL